MTRKTIDPRSEQRLSDADGDEIEALLLEVIRDSYRNWRQRLRYDRNVKEPVLTVAYLREWLDQARTPDDYRFAHKSWKSDFVKAALGRLKRKGLVKTSLGISEHNNEVHCYEPAELEENPSDDRNADGENEPEEQLTGRVPSLRKNPRYGGGDSFLDFNEDWAKKSGDYQSIQRGDRVIISDNGGQVDTRPATVTDVFVDEEDPEGRTYAVTAVDDINGDEMLFARYCMSTDPANSVWEQVKLNPHNTLEDMLPVVLFDVRDYQNDYRKWKDAYLKRRRGESTSSNPMRGHIRPGPFYLFWLPYEHPEEPQQNPSDDITLLVFEAFQRWERRNSGPMPMTTLAFYTGTEHGGPPGGVSERQVQDLVEDGLLSGRKKFKLTSKGRSCSRDVLQAKREAANAEATAVDDLMLQRPELSWDEAKALVRGFSKENPSDDSGGCGPVEENPLPVDFEPPDAGSLMLGVRGAFTEQEIAAFVDYAVAAMSSAPDGSKVFSAWSRKDFPRGLFLRRGEIVDGLTPIPGNVHMTAVANVEFTDPGLDEWRAAPSWEEWPRERVCEPGVSPRIGAGRALFYFMGETPWPRLHAPARTAVVEHEKIVKAAEAARPRDRWKENPSDDDGSAPTSKLSAAQRRALEKAVEAAQLYYGSDGYCSLKDQQKLYARMTKACEKAAKAVNVDLYNLTQQVQNEAMKRGAVRPRPGKDI